jgi:N-acyl-D-amino-acid deacylase
LNIPKRGKIEPGYYADIVIFDPEKVNARATYENPHQLSEGMRDVIVNGVLVLKGGEHTGAFPGRFVRGPGYGK